MVMVLAALGSAAGCSTATRAPVDVTYRFEGVRSGGGVDEWAPIRAILQKHSAGAVREERRRRATVGAVDSVDVRAMVTLPGMAAADEIHDELTALAQTSIGGSRVEFGLVDAAVLYRGNTVAAGVQLYVAGFATQGFVVKLFPSAEAEPVVLTAGRNGMWSAKLPIAPAGGWLYGLAEDPAGKARTRYFRVNVSNQNQEQVEEADFFRLFPQARPVKGAADNAGGKEKR
jgi:hypothetical protein